MQTHAYRVLLFDSRTMFRQGLRMLLERFPELEVIGEAGFDTQIASQARELRPDVVLMGLHGSGSDVLQAASNLRRELPVINILVLAVDADNANLAFQAIRAGVRGFVLQDTDIEDLVSALCLVAQGQAVLSPQALANLVEAIPPTRSPACRRPKIDRLTPRESEILDLMVRGVSNRDMAKSLFVSESTVRSHIHHILDKLEVVNRVQAVTLALSNGYGHSGQILRDSDELPRVPRRAMV